jgi:MFS family permease
VHGVPDQGYGLLLSINAGMVVLFQFWVTRRIKHLPPLIVMVIGVLLYAVGFSMYGFVAGMMLFITAMVIITIGEMLVAPVGQALVAALSPADMRGRYMAFYGFSWAIPNTFAPLAAGAIMDNYNPNWVWFGSGLLLLGSAGIFLLLQLKAHQRIPQTHLSKSI